ncbi:MAG: glycosyltransferase family 39 protein [Candidatus Sumerlaeaceae bacterium]|nr:glycosyltransferase family 39 protein [Candidatus Sumerlaeaceae bacterium]
MTNNTVAEAPPPETFKQRTLPREEIIVAVVAMLLAAFLRLVHVSYSEFFGSEFFTLDFVGGKRPPLLHAMFVGALPLYYEFIKLWGNYATATNELIMRLPSVAFGLLTCVAFFFYGQRYLRGTAFAVALLGFAFNPTLVSISNDATPFALLSLWAVLANYFCVRSLDEGGSRNWTLYSISASLGALTHPLFWFVLFAHFVFAMVRPRKTPRPFLLVSMAGLFVQIAIVIFSVVYIEQNFPKKFDIAAPQIDDVVRGLIAVLLGDFDRHGATQFFQAFMYVFVFACLILSFLYYRKRAEEAASLPENVVWIDETQDVVGQWKRMSLASFLLFQWFAFALPALGILILGSFVSRVELLPEYFVICLPPLVMLLAAGVDATPTKAGKIAMGLVFVGLMSFYNVKSLSDKGMGVYDLFLYLQKENFDPNKDALIFIKYGGLEKAVERYSGGIKGEKITSKDSNQDMDAKLTAAVAGKVRVYVMFNNDYRLVGRQAYRSSGKEWFENRETEWRMTKDRLLSKAEQTIVRKYVRTGSPEEIQARKDARQEPVAEPAVPKIKPEPEPETEIK